MQEHIVYWKDLSDRRIASIFGQVLDPKDIWGVAIVEVANQRHIFSVEMTQRSKQVLHSKSIRCPVP